MSLYTRVFCSFYTHRKTHHLHRVLGDDAFWIPPRIWSYAATNQPDGDFKAYSAEDLAYAIGYTKDAHAMLQALLQAGFLDQDMKIHDWLEHSGFHELYAARAKKAAEARWEKERTKEKGTESELRGAELKEHCFKHTSSNASSIQPEPKGNGEPPPRLFPKELKNLIKDAENEIEAIRCRGNLGANDRAEIRMWRGKINGWKARMFSQ